MDRSKIESLVGTKVNRIDLYTRAFTHKSALKQYTDLKDDYETLEFMGDSVLGFIITKWLFDKYSDETEGFLTRARTKIVRSDTLAKISRTLGLGDLILMDDKGKRNNWNNNPKIMEDVFEALIGAIYLDLGMIYARDFVLRVIQDADISLDDDNYKDQIMRYCQSKKIDNPEYNTKQVGTQFCVELVFDGTVQGVGFASTKKQAEQNAAEIALKTSRLVIPVNASQGPGTHSKTLCTPKV